MSSHASDRVPGTRVLFTHYLRDKYLGDDSSVRTGFMTTDGLLIPQDFLSSVSSNSSKSAIRFDASINNSGHLNIRRAVKAEDAKLP